MKKKVLNNKTYPEKYFGEYKPASPPPQMQVYGQWADSFV